MVEEQDLISGRNLQDGFGTPLRRFVGVFDGYTKEPAQGYEGTRVNLNFKDVEVLESIEPYNFPTATINIGLSNKKKSKWGYFAQSMCEFLPDNQDIPDAKGKKVGMVFTDGKDERPLGKPIWNRDADRTEFPDGEVPNAVWIVYEIEGATVAAAGTVAMTSTDRAKELLDGKSLGDFNKAAFADQMIRKDAELQRSITDKSFQKVMLESGEFTKDENDIYHKVAK